MKERFKKKKKLEKAFKVEWQKKKNDAKFDID